MVEALLRMSEYGLFTQVRQLFQEPINKLPEYLLLTVSKCHVEDGRHLVDDIVSTLMPVFLSNQQSISVLKKLWELN